MASSYLSTCRISVGTHDVGVSVFGSATCRHLVLTCVIFGFYHVSYSCWAACLVHVSPHVVLFGHVVRPGATGLLIGVEYSGARDNTWNTPYYLVSTRAAVGLVDVQGNYSTSLE